jgi:hypothetical protein
MANIRISAAHRHLCRHCAPATPNWSAQQKRTAAIGKRRKVNAHNDLCEMNKNKCYSFRTIPYSSGQISPSRCPRRTNPTRERGTANDFEAPRFEGYQVKRMCRGPWRTIAPPCEAVKESNQGDVLIKMRRCRILIRSLTNVPLPSTMPKYESCYANPRVGCMRKP